MIVGLNFVRGRSYSLKIIGLTVFQAGVSYGDLKVVAFSAEPRVRPNEAAKVYIVVENKGESKALVPPASKKGSVYVPSNFQRRVERYLASGHELEEGWNDIGGVSTTGVAKPKFLLPSQKIVYEVDCEPFNKDDQSNLSVVSISFPGFESIGVSKVLFYKRSGEVQKE